ncbi:hypothetical protein INT46_003403 [Mucor plumbeus]|uniref:Uncharacterized protein n=1 Tax=Mucor plumbeus TaxID=97098 RepID=A0A8H7UZL6_9FUNG|nr:hypothetical protein INT46_003403 [Mucor plumbeus]
MNLILVLFILSVILIQGIQSYCIYNKLTDGSSFDIVQRYSPTLEVKLFRKTLGKDAKECCPYTTWDCSPRPINYDYVYFTIYFKWPRFDSYAHITKCTSGGALTIQGSENDHWAECTTAEGITERIDLIAYDQQ